MEHFSFLFCFCLLPNYTLCWSLDKIFEHQIKFLRAHFFQILSKKMKCFSIAPHLVILCVFDNELKLNLWKKLTIVFNYRNL